jgi:tetratricopeptide (TPR) repeat protein
VRYATIVFLLLRLSIAAGQLNQSHAVSGHFGSALRLEKQGKTDEAIAEYRKAIEETPYHADLHYNLGRLLEAKGDHKGAREEFLAAIQLRPDDPDYHTNLGIELKNAGDLEGAADQYREALRLDPARLEAHLNLGNVFYLQKKLDAAEEEYRLALKLKPESAVAHMSLANVLDDRGELDNAIAEYRQAVGLDPANPNAHYNLAISLAKKRDPQEAISELRQAVKLAPAWGEPRTRLVKLLKQTDPQEAREACRQAEPPATASELQKLCAGLADPAHAPRDEPTYPSEITLSVGSEPGDGRTQTAAQVARTGAPAEPQAEESSQTLFSRGSSYFLRRDYSQAAIYYEKALALERRKPTLARNYWRVLVDNLAMAYGISGDLGRSRATLDYGLAKDPTYPSFYYTMACVEAESGDLDNAMANLKKAFQYRRNLIAGEHMPDPASDDSFERFKSDERFRKFLASLPKD